MPGRLAAAGRCRPAPAAAWPARAAAAAGVWRSSSWSSAGAVARKARSTSSRAACRDRGPQPPAAGGVLPHAARLLCAWPCRLCVAAGFPRCGCSLAPRRSKETQKTGDHGGIVRQPERHCLLLTDAGIPHLLEDGYRALRAPAASSMSSASSHAPGAKSCGLLLLSRWLPQPAARAAAFCDNAGGNGGLAHVCKLPGLHPLKDIRPIARNAID